MSVAEESVSPLSEAEEPINPFLEKLGVLTARYKETGTYLELRTQDVDIFKNGKGLFTDVTIKCRGMEWRAHKAILATKCSFFKACLSVDCIESQESVITLDDETPEVCELLLEFLYYSGLQIFRHVFNDHHRPYPDRGDRHTRHPSSRAQCYIKPKLTPSLIINLCRAADKYDIQSLFEKFADFFAVEPRFSDDLTAHNDSLMDILVATEEFTRTPQVYVLQEILIRNVFRRKVSDRLVSDRVKDVLREKGDLAVRILDGLLTELGTRSGRAVRYCSECGSGCGAWGCYQCERDGERERSRSRDRGYAVVAERYYAS